MLDCLERVTGANPTHAVIWLHGLGADAGDFWPIVPELRLPPAFSWRFVLPNAPVRNVSINAGMPMRAWFDVHSLDFLDRLTPIDSEGISESCEALEELVEREEARGIGRENIILAGFSQGGAIAARTALLADRPVAGVIALSTYLPLAEELRPVPACDGLACFAAHGRHDEALPIRLGLTMRDSLKAAGCRVQWREYDMGHQVCAEEIADISAFLQALPGASA